MKTQKGLLPKQVSWIYLRVKYQCQQHVSCKVSSLVEICSYKGFPTLGMLFQVWLVSPFHICISLTRSAKPTMSVFCLYVHAMCRLHICLQLFFVFRAIADYCVVLHWVHAPKHHKEFGHVVLVCQILFDLVDNWRGWITSIDSYYTWSFATWPELLSLALWKWYSQIWHSWRQVGKCWGEKLCVGSLDIPKSRHAQKVTENMWISILGYRLHGLPKIHCGIPCETKWRKSHTECSYAQTYESHFIRIPSLWDLIIGRLFDFWYQTPDLGHRFDWILSIEAWLSCPLGLWLFIYQTVIFTKVKLQFWVLEWI